MAYIHTLLGTEITWYVIRPKVWDEELERTVDPPPLLRTGVVWSHGPVTDTAWVIPSERRSAEGLAVCVAVSKDGSHRQRKVDQERSSAQHHTAELQALRLGWPLANDSHGYDLQRGA